MRVQFAGGLLLAFLVWAFLNTPDQRAWQVGLSALLAFAIVLTAARLIAVNFRRSTAAGAACLVLLLVLLWLTGFAGEYTGQLSTWLGSWLSLQRKKPVAPETVGNWLNWTLFLVRWIALPLLAALLALRARFLRFAPLYLVLFPIGMIAPHYLAHWVPKVHGLWPELLSATARFLAAYALMITAWVWLGRATRGSTPGSNPGEFRR
jgi:hypothetical protein